MTTTLMMTQLIPKTATCPTLNPVVRTIFSPLRFKLITTCLAEFDSFLNGLTDESIDRAMACFHEGLSTRKLLPNDFDPRCAQMTCHRILQMTENGSTAMGTVNNIPRFWINITGLTQSSNLTTVETTMTRVFCMEGTLKFHYWLLHIIPAALDRTSNSNFQPRLWIDRLAADVQTSVLVGGAASFVSSDYLPKLPYVRTYTMTCTKRRYQNREQLISIMSSTLRHWLHFPTEENSIAQLVLLEILLNSSLTSILFLDKIWEMYNDPFGTVFSYNWDIRRSKTKLTIALENFKKQFALHPFAITSSSSYLKLQGLSDLIKGWIAYAPVVDSNTSEMVSELNSILQEPY
jgi:hypothetical protein